MPEVLIVADDLTGAADTAAAFACHGMRTLLGWKGDLPECEVAAIDTMSRNMSPTEAVFATGRAVTGFSGVLYKKIDSTLRGNVGSEVAAALRGSRRDAVILAPAFPAMGRTTAGGKQLVNGVALPGDLPSLLTTEGLRVSLVPLEDVRSSKAVRKRADVYLFDAETEDDLARIAQATVGLNVVYAGSGGFARHLPKAMGKVPQVVPLPAVTGRWLTVIGSMSSVAQEQALQLAHGCVPLALRPELLREGPGGRSFRMLAQAYDRVLNHADAWLALFTYAHDSEDPALAQVLGQFCATQAGRIGGLILTGGETARAILDAFGVQWLQVIGEAEPGVPFSLTDAGLPVITKAGAFGDPDTLARIRSAFQ